MNRLLDRKFRTPQKAVQLLQQMLREREREDRYTGDMLISLLSQVLLTVLRRRRARLERRTDSQLHQQ